MRDLVFDLGPIVKCFWIEVCSSWPFQTAGIVDQPYLIEQTQVAQWAKYRTVEHRFKIDDLLGHVIEMHPEYKIVDNRKISDPIDFVSSHLNCTFHP